jgi:hypothetical protein
MMIVMPALSSAPRIRIALPNKPQLANFTVWINIGSNNIHVSEKQNSIPIPESLFSQHILECGEILMLGFSYPPHTPEHF